MPRSPSELLETLKGLGIETKTHDHVAVFTVEESKALRGTLPGGHSKNLFLKDKKGKMWLVVAEESRPIDLKGLQEKIGSGRLSFGSADRLMTYLGVEPGSVTPFALINDEGRVVQPVLDAGLLKHQPLNFHPLVNTMTTAITSDDLLKFIRSLGYEPQILDLED